MAFIRAIVDGINAIRTNVWAICMIGAGTLLTIKGHATEGGSLVTGAFALLKASPDEKPDPKVLAVPEAVPSTKT